MTVPSEFVFFLLMWSVAQGIVIMKLAFEASNLEDEIQRLKEENRERNK